MTRRLARVHVRTLRVDRSLTPYYSFRVAQAVVTMMPRPAAYALASTVARILIRVQPARLTGLRANLARVLPRASASAIDALSRRNARNLAKRWVDVMQMPSRPTATARRLKIDGKENCDPALARGRGAVILSVHLGAWETGIAGWNAQGHEMAVLAERLRPEKLFARICAARSALGVTVIPIDAEAIRSSRPSEARRLGARPMRQIVRHLRGGGLVAIAIDRDITGTGAALPFFGAPASIPLGVVDVAMRTGAALVPIFIVARGSEARAEVHPEICYNRDAVDHDAEVLRVTGEALRVCEAAIRSHPDQWHVIDPIWSRAS